MRFLACFPIDAASTRKSRSHKAVNQLDFEVTQPRRVIVGDVGYCISRNLIRVAMSHICYLFEGLTFSLWFGAFAPCRSGIDFTMPAKGSRAAHDNRKVRCVFTGILFPEGKGRLLEKHFESRGHPSAAKYLCIGKSGPQTAKAFKDNKKNPHYLHRQWGSHLI